MDGKSGIVWFRQDLRLHDNEALIEAMRHCEFIIPVYVFDERIFTGKTQRFGFPKTGKFRAKFIIESVEDLRRSLRRLGSELIVRVGKPEQEIFKIARKYKTSWVFCNRERTQEEEDVQDLLERKLWAIGQEMRYSRGKMLYYTTDLPFPITHTPEGFTQFRKEVERAVPVREMLPVPDELPPVSQGLVPGKIPSLEQFGHQHFTNDHRAVLDFQGGETAGLDRLRYYLWETDLAKSYFDTRNDLLGGDYSTKLSPWLAQGCVSPKKIYWELKRYEQERGDNKSTHLIFLELLRRDFFRLMAKKHGKKIFFKSGMNGEPDRLLFNDSKLLQDWSDGSTGVPFIDASMREIKNTGFLSNRGRQNVASFLINDLKVNWQMGAEYFESILIDYDTASNWCNWNYLARVGNDSREDRHFNIVNQASQSDPQGDYVKHWMPELSHLPNGKVHRPDTLSGEEKQELGFRPGPIPKQW